VATLRNALSQRSLARPAPNAPDISPNRRQSGPTVATGQLLSILVFAITPVAVLTYVAAGLVTHPLGHPPLFDFHGDLWLAGKKILHGQTPYDTAELSRRFHAASNGLAIDPSFAVPVYPAPTLLLFSPLAALPYSVSAGLFFALSVTTTLAALWVIGVRDWRCFGATFLGYPVVYGLVLGNLDPFLMLAAALAWRYRGQVAAQATAVAALIMLKLFLWPLLVWLVITRRSRTALVACAIAACTTAAAWTVIGFSGIFQYPHLLSLLSRVESTIAFSPFALLVSAGASSTVATAGALLLGGAVLGVAWKYRTRPAGDRYAFSLCLLAGLVMSPIVWSHYFALLYVVIPLFSPRLSWRWLAPAVLWPISDPAQSAAQIAFFLGLATLVCICCLIDVPQSFRRSKELATA
jgi:hypothetical protein